MDFASGKVLTKESYYYYSECSAKYAHVVQIFQLCLRILRKSYKSILEFKSTQICPASSGYLNTCDKIRNFKRNNLDTDAAKQ